MTGLINYSNTQTLHVGAIGVTIGFAAFGRGFRLLCLGSLLCAVIVSLNSINWLTSCSSLSLFCSSILVPFLCLAAFDHLSGQPLL